MKTGALLLALAVSAVQTVGWVECCCVLICKHRNDPCKDECTDRHEATPKADCCLNHPEPSPVKEEHPRCSHVEGSSNVVAPDAPVPPVALDVVLELPVVTLPPVLPDAASAERPANAIRGSPPLHLLYSVLLI
jgi:hypothetical protein